MTINFENQVVIVTGAGRGLGRTYAIEIARRGGSVVVNDLGSDIDGRNCSNDAADSVVDEIRRTGGRAVANYDTVGTVDGGTAIAEAAIRHYGRVDSLINNAGNMRYGRFETGSTEDLSALLEVNLIGAFNVTRPVYRVMKQQGYGRIVFTSSGGGAFGNIEQSAYGAAKMGVIGLMNVLSLEGRAHGVFCNALLPGAATRLATAVSNDLAAQLMPVHQAFASALSPDFVAPIAVYLASSECTSTHSIYSAGGGQYSRVFIGLTDGWIVPGAVPPTPDQIAEKFEAIRNVDRYSIPESLADQCELLSAKLG